MINWFSKYSKSGNVQICQTSFEIPFWDTAVLRNGHEHRPQDQWQNVIVNP